MPSKSVITCTSKTALTLTEYRSRWATAEKYAANMVEDSMTAEDIKDAVREHFKDDSPVRGIQEIVHALIAQVKMVGEP